MYHYMFSIFKFFKKKKVVPHIRLSGVIGSVGKFKQGLNFAGQQELIEKAFSIKKAKAVNMPSANIEKAVNKGIGNLPGIKYENYIYEGYGPGGVAIMMEVMTDNKNRTVPDIRHMMSKNGGNLGESGCVNWMFEKKGTFTISKDSVDEDSLLESSLDLGAEDINSDGDDVFVYNKPAGKSFKKQQKS